MKYAKYLFVFCSVIVVFVAYFTFYVRHYGSQYYSVVGSLLHSQTIDEEARVIDQLRTLPKCRCTDCYIIYKTLSSTRDTDHPLVIIVCSIRGSIAIECYIFKSRGNYDDLFRS